MCGMPWGITVGRDVTPAAPLPDPPPVLGAVGGPAVPLVDRRHAALDGVVAGADRGDQVGGERRDATPPRRVGGDEDDPHPATIPDPCEPPAATLPADRS